MWIIVSGLLQEKVIFNCVWVCLNSHVGSGFAAAELQTIVDFANTELKEGILLVVACQQHEGGKTERKWLDIRCPVAILGLPVISWELWQLGIYNSS